jgi:hypothetical protein
MPPGETAHRSCYLKCTNERARLTAAVWCVRARELTASNHYKLAIALANTTPLHLSTSLAKCSHLATLQGNGERPFTAENGLKVRGRRQQTATSALQRLEIFLLFCTFR